MIAEFVAGFMSNSLALISDAIHMFTHSFALVISLVAIIIASKKKHLYLKHLVIIVLKF